LPKKRKSRRKGPLPKGAYRLPNGNYVTEHVGPYYDTQRGPERLRLRAVHIDPPNVEKLAQAFMAIAVEEAKRKKDSDRAA